MFQRVRNRRTALVVTLAAAALSVAAVTPAVAGGTSAAAPAARTVSGTVTQGDPRGTVQRVADFYGAYIDAVWDGEDPSSAAAQNALRGFYLSAGAQKKVAAYEAEQHANGILFAQNVPVKWSVAYTGSGAGHATSRVTLTWSDGASPGVTAIDVQSDLATRKITDLRPVN
ncbi:hypothetical protein QQY24_30010 [Streptomyces sp. TG1A-8]|uniref:hypothetical protein n=1 Tax=Streptomyces sp. TG1A-8 TaxID=3051385 RepID=UPI00265BF042|nr:hypothetical protein [Streptomyces sp. TG1A-8]MDO0929439.1 hypothetical protein [Streptomyces sp. TG1A-8]